VLQSCDGARTWYPKDPPHHSTGYRCECPGFPLSLPKDSNVSRFCLPSASPPASITTFQNTFLKVGYIRASA
jgi:hypothetical protein